MLALAPPLQHSSSDYTSVNADYRQPSSSSSTSSNSSSRSTRHQSRKPSSNLSSSSSSSTVTPSSTVASLPATTPDSRSSNSTRSSSPSRNSHVSPFQSMKQHVDSKHHPSEPRRDPVDIHSVPPHDLLRLLATLLTQIASANDSLSSRSDQSSSASHFDKSSSPVWKSLTTASKSSLGNASSSLSFHARNIPTITLEAYLLRIHKYCPTTNEVFLSLLVYFDRMSKLAAQVTGKPFVIDSYNIHRLVIAGVTVASKFFSDVFYTNSRYAKVGGLPQTELNQLELQFLLLNDFRLMISPQEMQRYAEQLVLFSQLRSEGDLSVMPQKSPTSLSAPMQAMGAVDAYGGSLVGSTHRAGHTTPLSTSGSATSNHKNGARTPQVRPRELSFSNGAVSETDASDADTTSEAGTETDAETDDEPTIRPNHSSSSSDTMSMSSCTSEDTDTDGADDGRDHRMGSP